MSTPFQPTQPSMPSFAWAEDEVPEHMGDAFRWPTPPVACYPQPAPQMDHEPCEIVGLNGRVMKGHMIFFVPDQQVAQVQVPPSRTTMPLRFGQFRSLLLSRPFRATVVTEELDPHMAVMDHSLNTEYSVRLKDGSLLTGHTMGHVDTDYGLFLFPPIDADGTVTRLFIPLEAIDRAEFGALLGEVLIDTDTATAEQIDQAVDAQQRLRSQRLGEILLTKQVVTAEQLLRALDQQSKMPMVRIGEALHAMGLISEDQLQEALVQQERDRGTPLGELLIRMGLVSHTDLQKALARKMGYPLVNLDQFRSETDALLKVPFHVATRLSVVPLLLREGSLIVALEDPSKRVTMAELEFITQCKIVPVLAQPAQIEWAIRDAYANIGADVGTHPARFDDSPPVLDLGPGDSIQLVADLEANRDAPNREEDKPIEQSDNSLVRLINSMIVEAYTQGVSDIHVECYPGREKVKIRFRKDGELQPYLELPYNYRNALVARLKIMCDLDISERRKPQDGKINFSKFVAQHKLELRVATIPTNNGLEDVVMRILASAKPLPLDKIGLSPHNLIHLQEAMERPYGMVLCVGPTGSGKTTTLHSALSYINVPERKIWTAEDPIEITQPGLRQVQVNSKIDWTFAKALRAFLRADPDVIMVGEMRDAETAGMGIEASLTGHLVLSTLHTNSAPETVTRLLDMGMDPFNFADSLLVVLAQRLLRRLCTDCKTSEPATEEFLEELLADYLYNVPQGVPDLTRDEVLVRWRRQFGTKGVLMMHRNKGCERCGQTGFKGRAGIHELMTVSRDLRRMIQTGSHAEDLQQQAMREGMRTLRQDGIEKVLAGVTSMDEVRATSNR